MIFDVNYEEEESPVSVRILPQLESLWNLIGIPANEREEQMDELQKQFNQIYFQHCEELKNQSAKIFTEIESIHQKHRQVMAAYGTQAEEREKNIIPIKQYNLLQQLEDARNNLEKFKDWITERVQKIKNLVKSCQTYFDLLGYTIEERGEFAEVGETDFTKNRVERFKVRLEELEKEKIEREEHVNGLIKQIKVYLRDMDDLDNVDINNIFEQKSLTTDYLNQLKDVENSLNIKFKINIEKLKEYAVEIYDLWETLNVPDDKRKEFQSRYKDVGEKTLNDCKFLVESLQQELNKRLPESIEKKKLELQELWERLHISVESRFQINEEAQTDPELLRSEFNQLKRAILELKNFEYKNSKLLEAINMRQKIIDDYIQVYIAELENKDKPTSRDRGTAQDLIKEERIKKRFKTSLPTLDKRIENMLKQFKKKHGVDFEWDGVPYIEILGSDPLENIVIPKKKRVQKKKVCAPLNENTNANQMINL